MPSALSTGVLVYVLAICWLASPRETAADEPEVEGNIELLRAVHSALVTAEAQYGRGQLVAEIHDEWLDVLHSHSVIALTWDEQRSYFEAKYHSEAFKDPTAHDIMDPSLRIDDSEKEVYDSRLVAIETPEFACRYRPSKGDVSIEWRTDGLQLMPIFHAHPREVWLVTPHNPDSLWSRKVDMNGRNVPDRFVVKQTKDDDKIVIERHYDGKGPPSVLEVSQDVGLRVVAYSTTTPAIPARQRPTRIKQVRYHWEKLPSDAWVVREMEETQTDLFQRN